jgi:hypothetical protein
MKGLFIIMPGGHGKTTLSQKYPTLFKDVDEILKPAMNAIRRYADQGMKGNDAAWAKITKIQHALISEYVKRSVNRRVILLHSKWMIPEGGQTLGSFVLSANKIKAHIKNVATERNDPAIGNILYRNWKDIEKSSLHCDTLDDIHSLILSLGKQRPYWYNVREGSASMALYLKNGTDKFADLWMAVNDQTEGRKDNLPGGGLLKGETPTEGLRRELKEEGLEAWTDQSPAYTMVIQSNDNDDVFIDYVFVFLEKMPPSGMVKWLYVHQLPQFVIKGYIHVSVAWIVKELGTQLVKNTKWK